MKSGHASHARVVRPPWIRDQHHTAGFDHSSECDEECLRGSSGHGDVGVGLGRQMVDASELLGDRLADLAEAPTGCVLGEPCPSGGGVDDVGRGNEIRFPDLQVDHITGKGGEFHHLPDPGSRDARQPG